MIHQSLSHYIHEFSKLRTDRSSNWTAATKGQAPHKPFLLLAILDLFAEGRIVTNLIEITPELAELFAAYWETVLPNRYGDVTLPFFHLRSSKFWSLVPRPSQEDALSEASHGYPSQLQKIILGVRLDDVLYELLHHQDARDALRAVLIQTYFAPDYHAALLEQSQLNLQSYLYSLKLVEQAKQTIKELPNTEYKPDVRDQGFRKAVVRIYEHRCAFCGVRMLTASGHTAVDAAHIIPWSISQNDDIHNGMALCRLCHWTFDEGLTGVSTRYQVLLSKELRAMSQNLPGHLLTVENRQILAPADEDLWPDLDALGWHQKNIFLRG